MVLYKTIGITGSDGFIGSHLSKSLSKEYPLILFDLKKNKLKNNKKIKKDLFSTKKEDYEGIDILIHLAGTPFSTNAKKNNFELTKKVLDEAIKGGIKEFIFISSYAVYGNRKTPAKINEKLVNLDEYSESKILAEKYIQKKALEKGINYKILRICSIYGEGGKGLINIIKNKIKNKEEINFDSNFKRQYLHVEDLCLEISKILKENNNKKIINISGETFSTKKLYKMLIKREINANLNKTKKVNFLNKGQNKTTLFLKDYLFK